MNTNDNFFIRLKNNEGSLTPDSFSLLHHSEICLELAKLVKVIAEQSGNEFVISSSDLTTEKGSVKICLSVAATLLSALCASFDGIESGRLQSSDPEVCSAIGSIHQKIKKHGLHWEVVTRGTAQTVPDDAEFNLLRPTFMYITEVQATYVRGGGLKKALAEFLIDGLDPIFKCAVSDLEMEKLKWRGSYNISAEVEADSNTLEIIRIAKVLDIKDASVSMDMGKALSELGHLADPRFIECPIGDLFSEEW